jgi:hypothetical protein
MPSSDKQYNIKKITYRHINTSNIKTTTKIKNLSNLTITKIINIYYTIHKTWTPQKEGSEREERSGLLKQMYFNVNDKNAIIWEYFNLTTNAM